MCSKLFGDAGDNSDHIHSMNMNFHVLMNDHILTAFAYNFRQLLIFTLVVKHICVHAYA